jgi:hypothetical protein
MNVFQTDPAPREHGSRDPYLWDAFIIEAR